MQVVDRYKTQIIANADLVESNDLSKDSLVVRET